MSRSRVATQGRRYFGDEWTIVNVAEVGEVVSKRQAWVQSRKARHHGQPGVLLIMGQGTKRDRKCMVGLVIR